MDGSRFHAQAFGMRVRPEVIFRRVERIWFEGYTLAVTHSDGLEKHVATFEEMAAAASRTHAVVKTRNDTRIDVCAYKPKTC